MANEQSGSLLRRWRPFYGAFGAIDGAIEAATGRPRSWFRDARTRIVVLLRGAGDDDGVAEQYCAALDDVMVEALETLRVAAVPRRALTESAGLATAVAALGHHGSARIRSLADDVVRRWTAAGFVAATATAVLQKPPAKMIPAAAAVVEAHEKKLHIPPPPKMLPAAAAAAVDEKKLHIPPLAKMLPTATAAAAAVEAHKKKLCVPPVKKILPSEQHNLPPAKKMIPTAATATVSGRQNTSEAKKPAIAKMEATKRKLREGYQEAKRIKLQHTIQKINDKDAARMFEQKKGKIHHIVRRRCPAASSSGVRRSLLLPPLQMI